MDIRKVELHPTGDGYSHENYAANLKIITEGLAGVSLLYHGKIQMTDLADNIYHMIGEDEETRYAEFYYNGAANVHIRNHDGRHFVIKIRP